MSRDLVANKCRILVLFIRMIVVSKLDLASFLGYMPVALAVLVFDLHGNSVDLFPLCLAELVDVIGCIVQVFSVSTLFAFKLVKRH